MRRGRGGLFFPPAFSSSVLTDPRPAYPPSLLRVYRVISLLNEIVKLVGTVRDGRREIAWHSISISGTIREKVLDRSDRARFKSS